MDKGNSLQKLTAKNDFQEKQKQNYVSKLLDISTLQPQINR